MKTCSDCGEEKLDSGFPRYSNGTLRPRCKECANELVKACRANGPKVKGIEFSDPAAVWATKPIGQTYWQKMGEWMMGAEIGPE